jgi:hypothetical protein
VPRLAAGAAYYDLISSLGLPTQLAEVDPMVASHCGGIVGVLSAALAEEANNAKLQVGGWVLRVGWWGAGWWDRWPIESVHAACMLEQTGLPMSCCLPLSTPGLPPP